MKTMNTFRTGFVAFKILCVSLALFSASLAHATVGADDDLEILGVDLRDQKVFFTVSDESLIPEIYYIPLRVGAKPIHAKSLQPKTQTKEFCDELCLKTLENNISHLKKRLTPLILTTTESLHWETVQVHQKTIPWYGDPDYPTPAYDLTYQLIFSQASTYLVGKSHVIYYRVPENFGIWQAYRIPQRPEMLVITQYLGKPYETGYQKYDAVLLSPPI